MTVEELDRLVEDFIIAVKIDPHYIVDFAVAHQRWQNFREAHGLPRLTSRAEPKEQP